MKTRTHISILVGLCAMALSSISASAQMSVKGNCPPLKLEMIDSAKLENSPWFLCNFNFYTENPDEDNNFSCRIIYQIGKDSVVLGYNSYRGKDLEKEFKSFIPQSRIIAVSRKGFKWQLYMNCYLDVNSDGRIVRLNDSIFTVVNSHDIVLCKDGEYAFRYKNLIPENKRNDFLYVVRNSTVELEERFTCKGMDATNYQVVLMPCFPQDSLGRDTLPLSDPGAVFRFSERPFCIRFDQWCRENVRIPEGYTGNIVKGLFHVEFYINKYGYLNTFKIVRGLDSQLDAYLVEKIKEFPRILPAKDKDGNDVLYMASGRYSMYIPIE